MTRHRLRSSRKIQTQRKIKTLLELSIDKTRNLDHIQTGDEDDHANPSLNLPVQTVTRTTTEVHDSIESRHYIEVTPAMGVSVDDGQRESKLVTWDGPDDPENPKNWRLKKKWLVITTVSFFTLISPVSSTMLAPATAQIGKELGIDSSLEQALNTLHLRSGLLIWPPSPGAVERTLWPCSRATALEPSIPSIQPSFVASLGAESRCLRFASWPASEGPVPWLSAAAS